MSPERKPSKGSAIHRRRILAETRRRELVDTTHRITEASQASQRLQTIEKLLQTDSPESRNQLSVLSVQEQERVLAQLSVERVWALLKTGAIDFSQKNRMLDQILTDLETRKPEMYRYLTNENEAHISPLITIRDKYFPPKVIEGFHTKQ